MKTTFFYLEKSLKKLADDQCSSIAKGSIYHINHISIQPLTTVVSGGLTRYLMFNGSIYYVLYLHILPFYLVHQRYLPYYFDILFSSLLIGFLLQQLCKQNSWKEIKTGKCMIWVTGGSTTLHHWCVIQVILTQYLSYSQFILLLNTKQQVFYNVLWSSGICWKSGALIVIHSKKRNGFLLFSIVLRTLQLLITLEPLVQFRWGFQQNVLP